MVPLVFWDIHKQKLYKQLYFWLNLLSHIWLFEPMWAAIARSFWQPAYPWIYSTRRQWTLNLTCWISLNAWDCVTDYLSQCHLCSIVVGGCMSVYCSSKTWNMNTWQHTGCTVWPKSVIHTSCRSESSCNCLVILTKVELAYHLIYLTRIQWILNLTCRAWIHEIVWLTIVFSANATLVV